MVYAEVVLQKCVDWRTIKGVKQVSIPTMKDIPRAGPSNNPRAGLGLKKNIRAGVPDDEYVWSDHSSSESESDNNEAPTQEGTTTMDPPPPTMQGEAPTQEDTTMTDPPPPTIQEEAPRHEDTTMMDPPPPTMQEEVVTQEEMVVVREHVVVEEAATAPPVEPLNQEMVVDSVEVAHNEENVSRGLDSMVHETQPSNLVEKASNVPTQISPGLPHPEDPLWQYTLEVVEKGPATVSDEARGQEVVKTLPRRARRKAKKATQPTEVVINKQTPSDHIRASRELHLKNLLAELANKTDELNSLDLLNSKDGQNDPIATCQLQIESGRQHLSRQHEEILNLEAFYLRFVSREGGGSGSLKTGLGYKSLAKLLEKCKMEEECISREMNSMEEKQSTLKRMEELESLAPLDRIKALAAMHGWENLVPTNDNPEIEMVELKRMLAINLQVDKDLKKEVSLSNVSLQTLTGCKRILMTEEYAHITIRENFERSQREVLARMAATTMHRM